MLMNADGGEGVVDAGVVGVERGVVEFDNLEVEEHWIDERPAAGNGGDLDSPLPAEPTPDPSAPEVGLVVHQRGRGALKVAARPLARHEGDVDLGYLVVAHLEVADAPSVVRGCVRCIAHERADLARDDHGLPLREDPGLGRADTGDVAHRVDPRE